MDLKSHWTLPVFGFMLILVSAIVFNREAMNICLMLIGLIRIHRALDKKVRTLTRIGTKFTVSTMVAGVIPFLKISGLSEGFTIFGGAKHSSKYDNLKFGINIDIRSFRRNSIVSQPAQKKTYFGVRSLSSATRWWFQRQIGSFPQARLKLKNI